jgi:hypothetical protein
MSAYIVNINKLTIYRNNKLDFQATSAQELDIVVSMMLLGSKDTIKFIWE